ncbi:nucleotidyltransferase domain-containing protein [Sphingobacterium sp. SYP-B4668]|uniref:nucleotidyltransferase domain-containing protein n=1 Tax=Sphingobacterium sp. SYP-B4668 TaxID=2996035 RepID=UPI0022DD4B03|nr:nucleotidyltransferase [Sphingobacterium sp. SYP-B4668]
MLDIFNNYPLQREELLARIAQELQLDKTRLDRMESAYNAVAELLKNDKDFFDGLVIEVYAQGSKRIGATVRPFNKADFDLDVVLHIFDAYHRHSPEEIYNALVKALEKDGYYKTILEKKKRCVRLNYKSDFHMDILPACMPDYSEKERIKIPEKALRGWSSGNPKGFADWFLSIANSVKEPMLGRYADVLMKAQIETERLPEEAYLKTPLQRVVQLLKRYRDVFFDKKDYPVSSIVITTLAAHFYNAENSIFEAMDHIVSKIKNSYQDSVRYNKKFKVLNPVNPEEDFTDSWTNEHYVSFFSFIEDFHKRWQNLKNSFETSNEDYIRLFGEGVYKKTLNEQFQNFAKSTNNSLAKSSGLIAASIAFTSPSGNINSSNGYKNGNHHNFGGKY